MKTYLTTTKNFNSIVQKNKQNLIPKKNFLTINSYLPKFTNFQIQDIENDLNTLIVTVIECIKLPNSSYQVQFKI